MEIVDERRRRVAISGDAEGVGFSERKRSNGLCKVGAVFEWADSRGGVGHRGGGHQQAGGDEVGERRLHAISAKQHAGTRPRRRGPRCPASASDGSMLSSLLGRDAQTDGRGDADDSECGVTGDESPIAIRGAGGDGAQPSAGHEREGWVTGDDVVRQLCGGQREEAEVAADPAEHECRGRDRLAAAVVALPWPTTKVRRAKRRNRERSR